ncbi:hypothetical protein [Streptomyces sp. NPDC088725]|uniref:hypothetical protein n=1 Tax=Streptomyces sp. NPDC088725 TaxID=3365873 RepID=UPI003805F5A3
MSGGLSSPSPQQIRRTRRLMAYAIIRFALLTNRLTVVAVPGHHGEAVRRGVTRYGLSHAGSVSAALSA